MSHTHPTARRALRLVVAATLAVAGSAHASYPPYVYDDALGANVRFDRWQSLDLQLGGIMLADSHHNMTGSGLYLEGRFQGDNGMTGHKGQGSVGVNFLYSRDINDMSATVNTSLMTIAGNCSGAATQSYVHAGIYAVFFNSSNSSHPGDRTGDVAAYLHVRKDNGAGTVGIYKAYGRCDDAVCSVQYPYAEQLVATATVGVPVTLGVRWDQAGHQFLYGVNGIYTSMTYNGMNDVTPAHQPDKRLEVGGRLQGCPTGTAINLWGAAQFSDVRTNLNLP